MTALEGPFEFRPENEGAERSSLFDALGREGQRMTPRRCTLEMGRFERSWWHLRMRRIRLAWRVVTRG